MNTRSVLAIAGSTLLAACGSDGKSPTEPNLAQSSFTATVSGDVARALSGEAAFGTDNTRPDVGFGLVLVDSEVEEPEEMVVFYRGTAGIPGVGALTVADAASAGEDDDEGGFPDDELVGMVLLLSKCIQNGCESFATRPDANVSPASR